MNLLRNRAESLPLSARQFVKFCIVGGMNTALDWTLTYLLFYHSGFPQLVVQQVAHLLGSVNPSDAALFVSKCIATSVAVCNSFFWNRRWTFRVTGRDGRRRQFIRFAAVNLTGLALNSIIATTVVAVLRGALGFEGDPPKLVFMYGLATATGIVLFWNFLANRYWTFRVKDNGG
ncbi:MAG: GtrA family protein [Armatimonadetes bacterium]|nr:GtrA family protein [Armatimonadota bacterium]